MAASYRSPANSSSDDESEDSDKECATWKRATKRKSQDVFQKDQEQEMVCEESAPKAKRKRNTIWSDILQDEVISEDLGGCLLKNKPPDFYDRGHESYDYTLKYSDPRYKPPDVEMTEDETSSANNRLGPCNGPGRPNTFVPLNKEEKEAVLKINRVLQEKKVYLLRRVVKYLGIDKAISLLKMTEDIEENGGMMIANHTRRRTPGGVFIQLLKSDKDVSKEILDKIFEGEMNSLELKKHFKEINKKKKMLKKANKMHISSPNLDQSPKEKPNPASPNLSEECGENTKVGMEVIDPLPSVSVTSKNSPSDLEDGEISD